ncbi:MAG: SDR family NAD(P)-dependent oxidoreductase [Planctomycetaceae bacterium]
MKNENVSLPWVETKAFRDQVVLIVGAGRGIGEGLTRRFAQAGAEVVACDCVSERTDSLEAALKDDGLHVTGVTADITRVGEIDALFAHLRADFGRLDVLVNSAGFNRRQPIAKTDEALWDRTQDVNLKGPYFCTKAAAKSPGDGGGGRVVNLSSVGGYAAQMHLSAYSSAKGGLTLMTKALALELAPLGITVNAVGPGAVEGPWNEQFFSDPEYRRRWMVTSPIKRMATNDDIAAAVMFFASKEASYITGQVLYVDGGKLTYVPSVGVLTQMLDAEVSREAE